MKSNKNYLLHILESILNIENFTKNMNEIEFNKDKKTQSACMREIQIIGEASRKLTDDFREINNAIPWRDIIGMRNRVVHDYFGIDNELIWEVVRKDLPFLKTGITELINREPG